MKITEKLKVIEQKHKQTTHIPLNEETLSYLFGKYYKEKQVTLNNTLFLIPFEEEKRLYYILFFREEKALFLVQELNTGLYYMKTDKKIHSILHSRKVFYENRIPQKKEGSYERILFEQELITLNELLTHPSMRLLHLFR